MAIYHIADTLREVTDIKFVSDGTLKQVTERYFVAADKTLRMVWEYLKSCFSGGAWYNDRGWYNEEGWIN